MRFSNETAEIFVPDGLPEDAALARTTHLGIGAHQDDLEIMAYHGILTCHRQPDLWFTGVTCTNGAGSPRAGVYAGITDEEMRQVRRREQQQAASLGQYAAMIQLDHPSAEVKDPKSPSLREDLERLLAVLSPQVVYTHNPADKHDTHVAVVVAALDALRQLPAERRPRAVYGCEVWRNLDWLPDREKVVLDVSARPNLASALQGLFDSQISGGKRYDLAAQGRWKANATFFESHAVDAADLVTFAMDLTPLVRDPSVDLLDHVLSRVDGFRREVEAGLRPLLSGRGPGKRAQGS